MAAQAGRARGQLGAARRRAAGLPSTATPSSLLQAKLEAEVEQLTARAAQLSADLAGAQEAAKTAEVGAGRPLLQACTQPPAALLFNP